MSFLKRNGIESTAGMGEGFGWNDFFPSACCCGLVLKIKPKHFRADSVWADGLLLAASTSRAMESRSCPLL